MNIRAFSVMLAITSVATLNAGQIALGTGTAGTNGLAAGYVSPTSGATNPTPANTGSCAGASNAASVAAAGGSLTCYVPTTGGGNVFTTGVYSAGLFSGATPTSIFSSLPTDTLTAGGATFELMNNASDPTKNFWITNSANTTTASNIVIPVGIYGVNKVYTLLNDYWGGDGQNATSVIFTFNSVPNLLTGAGLKQVTFNLKNGETIRSGLDFNSADGGTGTAVTAAGQTIATTLSSSTFNAASGTCATGNVLTGCTVKAANAYTSGTYTAAANQFSSTTGKAVLDYQTFDFGTWYSTDFLVAITVRNQLVTGTGSLNNSRLALSAVTVNQIDSVPEPSTLFLAFAGLGIAGYYRRRKV